MHHFGCDPNDGLAYWEWCKSMGYPGFTIHGGHGAKAIKIPKGGVFCHINILRCRKHTRGRNRRFHKRFQ